MLKLLTQKHFLEFPVEDGSEKTKIQTASVQRENQESSKRNQNIDSIVMPVWNQTLCALHLPLCSSPQLSSIQQK